MLLNQSVSPRYAFDMISGMTHASAATTMKQFLDHVDGKEFVMCYVESVDAETGNQVVVPTDYDKLKQQLGADPFLISDGDPANPYSERLYNEFKVVFGFKVTMNKNPMNGANGITYSLRWLYSPKNMLSNIIAE